MWAILFRLPMSWLFSCWFKSVIYIPAPVLPTQGSGSSNLQRTHSNSSNPLNHATTLERSTPKPTVSAGVPKPAPRSSRDPNRSTLGSTISGASFTQTSTNGVLTTKSATSLTGTSMTGASYTGTSYTSYTGTLTDTGQSMGWVLNKLAFIIFC